MSDRRAQARDRPHGRSGRGNPLHMLGFAALVLPVALIMGLGVWFQFDGLDRRIWLGTAVFITALALWLRLIGWGRWAWLFLALWVVGGLFWWASIEPSQHRNWAPDVAHGVSAEIDGATVVLHNVRNFDWDARESFTENWETRLYDLDALETVDLFTSVWGSPAIAHTLISFGFAGGGHVTFSAEIRRERHEAFSELGGFFKKFELVMIAADESDIVHLRTNVRREHVSLFPLRITAEQRRALFLTYLDRANELAAEPEFYNTLTANCTTIIFQLARHVAPDFPMDWRILVSGYLPDYLHELGVIAPELPLEEVKRRAYISDIAQQAPDAADYSRLIREGMAL